MKDNKHDDERLAALLGGRLEGQEREELLAHLLADDEDYQVFADTAAILQEAEEEESTQAREAAGRVEHHVPAGATVPPSAKPGWRRWKAPRVIVPTVLAGLVALGTFVSSGRTAGLVPIALATSLEHAEQGLPAGWTQNPPWGDVRGGEERTAAEAGALLVDLTVSIQAGDTERTRTLAANVRTRFELANVPGSAIRQIEDRAGAPPETLQPPLKEVSSQLTGQLDRDGLRLGAWTEAARLAAARQDAAFFRSKETRDNLRHAQRRTRDNETAQESLAAVRVALAAHGADGAPNWAALATALDALMKAITT